MQSTLLHPSKMNPLIPKQDVCPSDLSLVGDVPWVLMPAFIKSWFSCLRWHQGRECWGLLCQPPALPYPGLDKPGQGCWSSQSDHQSQPGTWMGPHSHHDSSQGLPGPPIPAQLSATFLAGGIASSLLQVLPPLFSLSISFLVLESQELAIKASHKRLQTIASFVLSSWTHILALNSQRWESAAESSKAAGNCCALRPVLPALSLQDMRRRLLPPASQQPFLPGNSDIHTPSSQTSGPWAPGMVGTGWPVPWHIVPSLGVLKDRLDKAWSNLV